MNKQDCNTTPASAYQALQPNEVAYLISWLQAQEAEANQQVTIAGPAADANYQAGKAMAFDRVRAKLEAMQLNPGFYAAQPEPEADQAYSLPDSPDSSYYRYYRE